SVVGRVAARAGRAAELVVRPQEVRMRTVAEIRDRLLEDLRFTVWRPSMRGGNADATEVLLLHLLDTLCFIDGCEKEWSAVRGTYVQGCRWVRGHFEFQHRP